MTDPNPRRPTLLTHEQVERALDDALRDDASDPSRHLDAALATALGWAVSAHESGEFVGTPPGKAGTHLPVRIPAYSSLDAVAAAEAEIGRRGLGADYLAALWSQLGLRRSSIFWTGENIDLVVRAVTAPAEQRARAAVETLANEKGSP